jgi:hypothetical protein
MTTALWTNDSRGKEKNVHKPSISLDDYWSDGSFRRRKIGGIQRLQQEILHPKQRCSCSSETLTQLKQKNGSKILCYKKGAAIERETS